MLPWTPQFMLVRAGPLCHFLLRPSSISIYAETIHGVDDSQEDWFLTMITIAISSDLGA